MPGRKAGPDPLSSDDNSLLAYGDRDGTSWLVQELMDRHGVWSQAEASLGRTAETHAQPGVFTLSAAIRSTTRPSGPMGLA